MSQNSAVHHYPQACCMEEGRTNDSQSSPRLSCASSHGCDRDALCHLCTWLPVGRFQAYAAPGHILHQASTLIISFHSELEPHFLRLSHTSDLTLSILFEDELSLLFTLVLSPTPIFSSLSCKLGIVVSLPAKDGDRVEYQPETARIPLFFGIVCQVVG